MTASTQPVCQRWKCVCAYNGADFEGWQSQAGGRSVQDIIEKQLARILGKPTRIHGSGRTDSGVHAHGQVFHFDASWRHGSEKLLAALHSGLPATIQIKSARTVPSSFHSRFSASGKIYSYHLFLGMADPFARPYCWSIVHPLDFKAMVAAAAIVRGKHDFKAFSAVNREERENTVRELKRFEIVRRGRRVRIVAEADGFLYKMVRSLVGGLVAAGEGRISLEQLRAMLATRQRPVAVRTAPPYGLFLEKVLYPPQQSLARRR